MQSGHLLLHGAVLPAQVLLCVSMHTNNTSLLVPCCAQQLCRAPAATWLTLGLAAEVMMPGTITSLPTRADCRGQQEGRAVVSWRRLVLPEGGAVSAAGAG